MSESSPKESAHRPYQAGYEPSGVRNKSVLGFTIGLGVMLVVIGAVLWWWQISIAPGGPPQPERLDVDQPLQPSPGHVETPWEDLAALRAKQEQELHAYGAVAADGTHARIPIERAMDLLLQSGALTQPWQVPTTLPYQFQTVPPPRVEPSVRNRT